MTVESPNKITSTNIAFSLRRKGSSMGSVRLLLLPTHLFNHSVCILLSHIVGGDDDTEWCALIKFYSVLEVL